MLALPIDLCIPPFAKMVIVSATSLINKYVIQLKMTKTRIYNSGLGNLSFSIDNSARLLAIPPITTHNLQTVIIRALVIGLKTLTTCIMAIIWSFVHHPSFVYFFCLPCCGSLLQMVEMVTLYAEPASEQDVSTIKTENCNFGMNGSSMIAKDVGNLISNFSTSLFFVH